VYADRAALAADLVPIIAGEIRALAEEGVPYIQLDQPGYTHFADPELAAGLRARGVDVDQALDQNLAIDNACLAEARRPGVIRALHMCRGNAGSQWLAQGGYDPIAEKLFTTLDVDRFLLEYDSPRAGSFEPLRFVPPGKQVVLGLVSTKRAELESQDELLHRIEEAARYVPVENLALSPQCGFAPDELDTLTSWDQQWRKLELVADTARKVWP
jgi:5-methyltetrahydropteroyltriglutamate--homocysteine methyltransferase